ncbi:MAG: phosphatidylglycerophosphatase A [Xanthomonadales bacterium]|nr:phosphatidylglycerophosphatase A [Xanthomonadales bacterium]
MPERKSMFTSDPALRKLAFGSPWGFLALGFGSGLVRRAPGTAGTIVAIPLALALTLLPTLLGVVVVLSMLFAGVPLCRAASAARNQDDTGAHVWDEIVGFCLVVVLIPPGPGWFVAAFFAFRFFDIVKPWPIRWLEMRRKGGIGIMVDDAAAALYAVAVIRLAHWVALLDYST